MSNEYTYEEAYKTLGISRATLNRAISHGVLTPIKKEHTNFKYLSKESVDALAGKPIRVAIKEAESKQLQATTQVATPRNILDANAMSVLVGNGAKIEMLPDGKVTIFQQALVDENGDTITEEHRAEIKITDSALLLGILLGLALLLLACALARRSVPANIERTIEQMGLEKEDLTTNQREVIATLRQHPKEVQELRNILEDEGYSIEELLKAA